MPSYNSGQYLDECLESILSDIVSGAEVIVINDGSTDNSIDRAKIKFGRYVVSSQLVFIDQSNGGVSKARNAGLEAASGKYLAFLDSDDKVQFDFIRKIFSALKYDPDIVVFNLRRFDGWRNSFVDLHNRQGLFSGEDARREAFRKGAWFICARVIKKDLFFGVRFPEGMVFEDVMTIPFLYLKCTKVFYIKEAIYFYRVNYNGICSSVDEKYIDNMKDFYIGLEKRQGYLFVLYRLQILKLIVDFSVRLDVVDREVDFVLNEVERIKPGFANINFLSSLVFFGYFPRVYILINKTKKKLRKIRAMAFSDRSC